MKEYDDVFLYKRHCTTRFLSARFVLSMFLSLDTRNDLQINVPFERVKKDFIAHTICPIDARLDDIPIYSYIFLFCWPWYFYSVNFSANKNVKRESSEQRFFMYNYYTVF